VRGHLSILIVATTAALALAYTSFVAVVMREGARYFQVHAEIRLAREIHASLVPVVAGRRADVEWQGRSRPSGAVGGDLVDVIGRDAGWIGCVADVSGHGVAAGLLMGMFKTALHASAREALDLGDLLTRTNSVISPLKQSNMFVTTACVRLKTPAVLEYVLAGHPPLLHVRPGTSATWIGESQLAIGLVGDARYEARTFAVQSNDLVLAVTDGLFEVFDRQDRELGLAGLARAVQDLSPGTALADVEDRIFAASRAHGAQVDDQTLLAVRILSPKHDSGVRQ
jgi:sigma-B regulation protein RsbU (phosphoserine phosphatase)